MTDILRPGDGETATPKQTIWKYGNEEVLQALRDENERLRRDLQELENSEPSRLREWVVTVRGYGELFRAIAGVVALGICPVDLGCLAPDEDAALRTLLGAIRRARPVEYERGAPNLKAPALSAGSESKEQEKTL